MLPSGFTATLVVSGLASPTAMQFAPDGRLFVAEQGGRLRVIKDGALLPTPFITLTVSSVGERGLLGVAFDPDFATSTTKYVYLYYTATTPAIHNRISRFTANGDVAVPGSEVTILDLDNLSSATNHNGGALAFGSDGKLYAAVGENAFGANAQMFTNLHGKMLRINKDGTFPADNPFLGTTSGKNRAIYALGLRNPFTFAFHPTTARMFINDVGQSTWEEINDGLPGANYGWPDTEGATSDPRFVTPIYAYPSNSGTPCAITGGAFYSSLTQQFPAEYQDDYFFADYCAGWIRRLDPSSGAVPDTFASGIASPVDLKVGNDGSLYYLARGSGGVVYRISYTASAPSITTHPSSQTVAPGASVTFSVRASGPPPLQYQWQRDGVNISGATAEDYTKVAAAGDNGARFRAIVSNANGNAMSNEAVLVRDFEPATHRHDHPTGSRHAVQRWQRHQLRGNRDGSRGRNAWSGRLHLANRFPSRHALAPVHRRDDRRDEWLVHGSDDGTHRDMTSGIESGSSLRDSAGATRETSRDVNPRKVSLTLATNPPGLQLLLDAQPLPTPTPLTFTSVVGIVRRLGAPLTQSSGGTTYEFVSWSDGGAATHDISTPSANTTYTATYRVATGGTGNGLSATYYNNSDFTGTTVARVDPTVDFVWGSGSPAAAIGVDTFSARWTGQVEPQFTGSYTFYTVSDDGVRLWVNGQQIINNWTDHGTDREQRHDRAHGRPALRHPDGVLRERRRRDCPLLWSSASVPKAVIPGSRLYAAAAPATAIRINFQPASAPVPSGYLADGGLTYAARGNGQTYGWNADNTAQTRDRNAANSADQSYDTLTHLQKVGNPDAVWEIAVPNGTYVVRVVSGDASNFDSVFRMTVEGILTVTGTPTSANRWIEGTSTVTVTDGRLTIRSGAGASNNKICFVEVTAS